MARSNRSGVEPQQISSTTGSVKPGVCASYVAPPDSSVGEFVLVPGNPTYGTSDFYVAKYEAKNVGGKAVSQSAGAPWVSINQTNAKTAATDACSGCHLITEPEWMTIAMNLVNNPANWSGGSVGNGYIYRGNSNSAAAMDGSNALSGVNTRPLKLSTGEEVWDMAGNVWEWTDATITGGQPGKAGQSAYGWTYYHDGTLTWNSLPATSRPTGTLYSNSQGVGGIYSNPSESATRAFLRGGSWGISSYAGVWALNLYDSPSTAHTDIGFRVSR